ncbi:MAG: hypothetical protein KJZ87_21480, partial [Thermoguttaceae bacterium]|nr:hypothetical protein [Thermoguttaceae bacterium]
IPGRMIRYGQAVSRWIAAGRPTRSAERVRQVFETHCRPCEHFDPATQTCRLCGCHVAPAGPAYRNKIGMATERCPAEPPKWSEEASR